jgi:hypothetical protein
MESNGYVLIAAELRFSEKIEWIRTELQSKFPRYRVRSSYDDEGDRVSPSIQFHLCNGNRWTTVGVFTGVILKDYKCVAGMVEELFSHHLRSITVY